MIPYFTNDEFPPLAPPAPESGAQPTPDSGALHKLLPFFEQKYKERKV